MAWLFWVIRYNILLLLLCSMKWFLLIFCKLITNNKMMKLLFSSDLTKRIVKFLHNKWFSNKQIFFCGNEFLPLLCNILHKSIVISSHKTINAHITLIRFSGMCTSTFSCYTTKKKESSLRSNKFKKNPFSMFIYPYLIHYWD